MRVLFKWLFRLAAALVVLVVGAMEVVLVGAVDPLPPWSLFDSLVVCSL